jgi:hypothetical protein
MKVHIWWPDDQAWYEGTIIRASEHDPGKWWVLYFDGHRHVESFGKGKKWKYQ